MPSDFQVLIESITALIIVIIFMLIIFARMRNQSLTDLVDDLRGMFKRKDNGDRTRELYYK